ncbi:hypothetical protein ABC970_20240 [Bacillus licheniformis]|uniref:hypothetical protein n=1 Tax=Bacillus TaxID=1386 RepID=UPI0005E2DB66|nr:MULTISPECIES: hypothetical protein [Bacillus]KJH56468.1 hypothetical protein UF14_14490 [Bacillus licheniformis]MBA1163665.1 hypothetical protein [Bacillus licheniformis]MBS2762927.1 hypothetical protein [Bacillus licheniformis]MCD2526296.1 hypothetical protein [Bacillus licheniformis]MDE1397174.1 hypothetical protein [Bacillus licheniformis]
MIKTRNDFPTESQYIEYTRTYDFLNQYCIKDKSPKEIIADMALYKDWLPYVEKALPILLERKKTTGYDLRKKVDDLLAREDEFDFTEEDIKAAEKEFARKRLGDEI